MKRATKQPNKRITLATWNSIWEFYTKAHWALRLKSPNSGFGSQRSSDLATLALIHRILWKRIQATLVQLISTKYMNSVKPMVCSASIFGSIKCHACVWASERTSSIQTRRCPISRLQNQQPCSKNSDATLTKNPETQKPHCVSFTTVNLSRGSWLGESSKKPCCLVRAVQKPVLHRNFVPNCVTHLPGMEASTVPFAIQNFEKYKMKKYIEKPIKFACRQFCIAYCSTLRGDYRFITRGMVWTDALVISFVFKCIQISDLLDVRGTLAEA